MDNLHPNMVTLGENAKNVETSCRMRNPVDQAYCDWIIEATTCINKLSEEIEELKEWKRNHVYYTHDDTT